jgi:hypothetical protein
MTFAAEEPTARTPTPFTARFVLLLCGVLLIWGIWQPLPRHGVAIPANRTDQALYGAVTKRMAAGESYYPAMGLELRARGYPTASVFNWRQPTIYVLIARHPFLAYAIVGIVGLGVVIGTIQLFYKSAPEVMIFALIMQIGATLSALGPISFVLSEAWAGALLAASGLLYARQRHVPAAVLAVAALFIRELVAPYAAVAGVLALRHGRRNEILVWVIGGLTWAGWYAYHAMNATDAMQAGALAHPPWIQFGGPRFVLATIGFAGWLYLLPTWTSALAAVLLVASPWAPLRATHLKAAVLVYLAFFAVVGQSFNQSWGILAAPIWSIGFGLGLLGLAVLIQSAFGRLAPVRRDHVSTSRSSS